MSRPGHRLRACGADRHPAGRFVRNGGQDARLPHGQDGRAPLSSELFNRAVENQTARIKAMGICANLTSSRAVAG